MGVEDTVNIVFVNVGHIDGHAFNVDHGYTDRNAYTCTWSFVVSRGTIGGKNVQP